VRDAVAGGEIEHGVADDAVDARRDFLEMVLEFRAQLGGGRGQLFMPLLSVEPRVDTPRNTRRLMTYLTPALTGAHFG
jgi:hypothetical protein